MSNNGYQSVRSVNTNTTHAKTAAKPTDLEKKLTKDVKDLTDRNTELEAMLIESAEKHAAQLTQIVKQRADLVGGAVLIAELHAGRDEQAKILDEQAARLVEMKACIARHDEELKRVAVFIQKIKGMGSSG